MSETAGDASKDSERLAHFEHGDAIEVPAGRIERELDALWREAAAAPLKSGEKRRPVTRACLWNLIVRADGDAELQAAKLLVDGISLTVPARAIVLKLGAGGDRLRAWVEANWRRGGAGDSGSDEVTLEAGGEAAARLPALVRALLLTDVPTTMLWMGSGLAALGPRPMLVDEVDRLIVDTRKLTDEAGLGAYARLAGERPELELADLAWLGVSPLRGLLAALFDPPRDPAPLEKIDRAVVVSGVEGTQARALLTLGWLCARLKWTGLERLPPEPGPGPGKDGSARRWRGARRAGGTVELVIETQRGCAAHGVAELRLEAGGEVWSLTRDRAIAVRGPGLPQRLQPARKHTDVELVVSALGARGRDPVYREALACAAKLVDCK